MNLEKALLAQVKAQGELLEAFDGTVRAHSNRIDALVTYIDAVSKPLEASGELTEALRVGFEARINLLSLRVQALEEMLASN